MTVIAALVTGLALVALAGCGPIKVPVAGYIGKVPAQGQAVANLDGDGKFHVLTTGGLRCGGTYDALDTNPTIATAISCSDGRSGTAVITRTMDMLSGTVIAELEDGTTGRFVFGNLTFAQGAPPTTKDAVRKNTAGASAHASPPASSSPVKQPELVDGCAAWAELAEAIMMGHQAGVPMTENMEIAATPGLERHRDFIRQMVISAYEMPRFSTPEYQQRTVGKFRDAVAVACYRRRN